MAIFANFQNGLISQILAVFWSRFSRRTNDQAGNGGRRPAGARAFVRAQFRPHRFDEADVGHDLQRRMGASVLGRER